MAAKTKGKTAAKKSSAGIRMSKSPAKKTSKAKATPIKAKTQPKIKSKKTIKPKKLIVFYSFHGNCKLIAHAMAKAIHADTLELKLKDNVFPKKFAEYKWGGYQVYQAEMPILLNFKYNPMKYDFIIIGTPVWAFTFSPPLRTFFKHVKLQGKKIGLFCCHEGGIGETLPNMEDELQKNNILGRIDFLHPLTHGKDKAAKRAAAWAKEMAKKL